VEFVVDAMYLLQVSVFMIPRRFQDVILKQSQEFVNFCLFTNALSKLV